MGRTWKERNMSGMRKQCLKWALVALFVIVWTGIIAACCAADGQPTAPPGDPADIPPTCQVGNGTSAAAYMGAEETLEPTSGILGSFWMILMAMAFQLAL
jgi:hypothetical protein